MTVSIMYVDMCIHDVCIVSLHACMCMYVLCLYMYVCMYVCVCIHCVFACMYTCMHAYV